MNNNNKKIHLEAAALAVLLRNSCSSSSGAERWDFIKGTGSRFWIAEVVKSTARSDGDVDRADLSVPQFPSC